MNRAPKSKDLKKKARRHSSVGFILIEWRRRESNPQADLSNALTASGLRQGPSCQSVNVEYPGGSVCHQLAALDSRLPELIAHWNALPSFAKEAIFAIVLAAKGP